MILNVLKKRMAILVAVMFSLVMFSACGDDDDEPNNPNQSENVTPEPATDALSNTSWTVTSMTGWGSSAISEWRGMRLVFGNNGKVTEWLDGDNVVGTYSISGNTLKLNGLEICNEWGYNFNFTVSGNRLTLVADKGSSMETSFIFSKN